MSGLKRKPPAEGDRVSFETVDGVTKTGTVDLVMPGKFAVNVDEEFWHEAKMVGTGEKVPTHTREIINTNDIVWRAL